MAEAMISTPVPRFTRNAINEMREHLLTMNLEQEGLLSTGSFKEKQEQLIKHFYPTTHSNDSGPNANVSASINHSRTQINSLPVGPLKAALAALGLPFNGGLGDGRASLKAALYPPPVVTGTVTQPNLSQLPSSQSPGAFLCKLRFGIPTKPKSYCASSTSPRSSRSSCSREQHPS
jgi:hypothetical protein